MNSSNSRNIGMLNAMRKQRWVPRVTLLLFFWTYGVQAQQIAVDGMTDTAVAVNGSISDVTTNTVNGSNAYNSFSVFDVYADNTVNLHLPDGTDNLLNLVHDQTTTIDGMLNAIRNGRVGGNVYFANPHGFVVGANGVINVGSLSLSTPTSQFMEEFFTAPGQASVAHTDQLLNYTMPLNDTGLISIQGRVNAIGDIDMRAGSYDSSGVIQAGAVFTATAPDFSDVVNLADVETGTELSVENGTISIVAADTLSETGTIASKGGAIDLSAKDIAINGGAVVSAAADGAVRAGNVDIAAAHLLDGSDGGGEPNASSSVAIDTATITGHDIAITAHAANAREAEGSEIENELLGVLKLVDLNAFEAGGVQAASLHASATATVDIGAGAVLDADHDITLGATADSEARISALELLGIILPVGVGGAYAESVATARAEVRAGASLTAGNLIDVDAAADNVVEVSSAGLSKSTALLSIAEVTTDADAAIDVGATINAYSVDIDATSTSDIQNFSGPIPLVGANGLGISLTSLSSSADALMGANADLGGDLNVDALSTTTRNTTIAKSKVKPGIVQDSIDKFKALYSATSKGNKAQPAAAFAVADSEHVANASIGAGADISAANIGIKADTFDNFKLIADTETESKDFALGSAAAIGDYHNEANGYIGDNAMVDARDQLTVDAKTKVPTPVDPEVLYFWQADNFFEGVKEFIGIVADVTGAIAEAFLTSSSIAQSSATEGTGIAGMYTAIDVDNDANAYVGSGAQVNADQTNAAATQSVSLTAANEIDAINLAGGLGSGNTLGGAVNDLGFDVDVKASIADGATVNALQDVNVDAHSTENLINIAVAGGSAQAYGLVGSVNLIDIDNNVQAVIDDQANLHAGNDVNVTAHDTANNIAISGGVVKGANTGVGFAWAVNKITSIVKAFFGDDENAETPGAGAPGRLVADHDVNLHATSEQNQDSWSLAGAIGGAGSGDPKSTAKGSAGFGASGDVSLNTLEGETAAFIDDVVTVDADFVLDVNAVNTANLAARSGSASLQSGAGSSGIAGSYSENSVNSAVRAFIDDATIAKRPDGTYTVVQVNAESAGGISSVAIGGGGSGKVSIAGSVAVNDTGNGEPDSVDTEAYISNSTLERANVDVSATDHRSIDSITGALSVSGTAGIGPSVSINNTANDTRAYLDNSTIEQANGIAVTATNTSTIQSIAASAGVGTTTFGGAGSLTHNTTNNTTEAYARDSRVNEALHDVSLAASDTSTIRSIAGGGAFGSSVGVGISAAYNAIANRVHAFFDGGTVDTGGSVLVSADSDADIETVGVGIGASGSLGLAGSVSINKLQNETSAAIGNGADIRADDNVKVAASSTNGLLVVAGSASGGASGGGGGAVVVNIVDNDTTAAIEGSDVRADGNGEAVESYSGEASESDDEEDAQLLAKGVVVDAYSREDITSANVNGAGGGSAGVAASTSVSTIKDTTTARITAANVNQPVAGNANAASADQGVRVAAYQRVAFGGGSGNGAGGGAAGVGVGVDATVIKDMTEAYVDDGSKVRARQAIALQAAHREDVLSASVGGAGGGTAGIVGSGNGARMASTTRAFAVNSDLESAGSLDVNAHESANLVQIAGGIAGGGAVGGTGAVGVGIVENTTEAYLGSGAVTNAGGATTVAADSDETIDHYVISASGGGTVGVAANVSVKKAQSTTRAFIDGGAEVNQDTSVGSAEQDVAVTATSNSKLLGAVGGASGAGVVGGGAALDLDFVKNTTTAYIGDGASVRADGDVTVDANAHKDVRSFVVGGGGGGTVGVSAMVSVINVGAKLDDDSRGQVGNAGGYTDSQVAGDNTQGVDSSDSFAASTKNEAAADNSGTAIAGDVNETSTEALDRTSAFVGDLAVVSAGENVQVHSMDRTEVEQNVGGIAVSLGGAVGGSVGVVNTNTYNQALIGSGAAVDSGAIIDVDAYTDNDVTSNAIAGAGGLVSIGASVAVINDDSVTLAQVEDNAVIDRAARVDVNATTEVTLDSFAYGATAGAGAVGASIARSNSDALTKALVSDHVMIGQADDQQVGGLQVHAVSDVDADAWAIAGTAGIVSGSGADARTNIASTTQAQIGQSSDIDVSGDIDVNARALTQGEARADGVNVAGLTVGVSLARADATPTVLAAIGAQSQLTGGDDITVSAAHNVGAFGNELTDRKMHARAFSATGALVGGVGSDARASVTPDVDTRLDAGAHLVAADDAILQATNVARAEADANGQAYGVAARGITHSEAMVDAHTDVTTALDVIVEAADIVASAVADLFTDADTLGGNGGILSKGGTTAKSRIDNATTVTLGTNNTLDADQSVTVAASTALEARSNARVGAGGAVTINQVSADTDIANSTTVNVGQNTTLTGNDVTVQALVTKLVGYAKAASTTIAVGSDSQASSHVDVESQADVVIPAGVELRGQNSVSVTARTTGIDIDSIADAKIGAGLTGNLSAVAHGDLDVDSDVDVQAGSIITSPNISLLAETVSNDGDFVRDADANANTVVNWVLQKSTTLVRKAEKIPFIGWFFKWVRKTVFKWVAEALQSDVSEQRVGGDPRTDNSIQMHGTLAQLTALSPQLTVNADRTIDTDGNINATIVGDEVVVNGVNNNVVGNIDISSPGGMVSGTGTLLLTKTFGSVDMTNNSDLNMRINNIDVLAVNAEDPELSIDADLDLTDFETISEVAVSDVNVQGNTGADIIIAGRISNPAGVTNIDNTGGSILSDGGVIESNKVSLSAAQGDIGQAGNLIRVNMIRDFENAELNVLAGGSAYLDVQLAEYLDEVPENHIVDGLTFQQLTAGQDMVLNLRSGIVYDLPGDPALDPIPVAVVGNYQAGIITAGGDLSITEEAMADFRYDLLSAAQGSIDLNLDNGDAVITRIEAPNGGVTIRSAGAIIGAGGQGDPNIMAVDVDLSAAGGIGAAANPLEIDQAAGGVLNAAAAGDVHLSNPNGGFGIGLIDALGHLVSLLTYGSVLNENDDDELANIAAQAVTIESAGSVGAADKRLQVNSGDGMDAGVDIAAADGIYIAEREGDLHSSALTSAAGSIDVLIVNGNGHLGSVSAPEDVTIIAGNGNLDIGSIDPATVMLAANGQGSTIDVDTVYADSSIQATAGTVNLYQVTHTGDAGSTLDMDIDGDFNSTQIGSASGGLDLLVSGTATLGNVIVNGDLAAVTGGALTATTLASANGSLYVNAGTAADLGSATALNLLSLAAGNSLYADHVAAQRAVLGVAAELGSLHVLDAVVPESIALSGDNITLDRLLDSNDGGMRISVTGNDGGLAQNVSMVIESAGDLVFDVFKSVYSNLMAAYTNTVTFETLVVGELFDLETAALHLTLDYKDSKDNENSEVLVTRDQPIYLNVEDTKVTAEGAENLFVIKEKL